MPGTIACKRMVRVGSAGVGAARHDVPRNACAVLGTTHRLKLRVGPHSLWMRLRPQRAPQGETSLSSV
eukprot:901153-Alexandrium_andersonii.AAC.1